MNLDFIYYISTDHLGSINLIVDGSNGNVVDDLSYDAWGRNRNPVNWTYSNITLSSVTDRGYTSHEQLPNFGLINMNGRIYDPMTMNFLSPDPFVQNPSNSQNYNRFSYVLNNPLKYTDPSGYNYSYYIDGLPVSERNARRYLTSNWDNIDLNFHSTRGGFNGINANITYKPNKIDGEAFKNSFRRLENLTGAAFTWKDSKLGRWSFYSFGYEDNLEEVSGENWPGVWLTKSAAAGASFNEISGLEYFNGYIDGIISASEKLALFNEVNDFWSTDVKNTYSIIGTVASMAEFSKVYGGMWYSNKANKWFSVKNRPNGFTGPKNPTINAANNYNTISKAMFWTNTIITSYDAMTYYYNDGKGLEKAGWSALEIGIGVASTWGGIFGLALGTTYFLATYPMPIFITDPYYTHPFSPWNSCSRRDNTGINNNGGF